MKTKKSSRKKAKSKVLKKKRAIRLKPFKYSYKIWADYRAISLKKIGVLNTKHKNYKDRYRANINKDIYNKEKEGYLKSQLNKILVEKYESYKRRGESIKKEIRNVITKKLKGLGYSKQVISLILTQKNALKSIYEFQKTVEDKRLVKKEIKVSKNKVYDYKLKKTYTKLNYNRKLAVERYWYTIHSLSKSLNLSIKEVRELYKFGGPEFFKALLEKIDSPDFDLASPEELQAYWANVKSIAKETGLSYPEVRAILKINPSHFNHLK